MKSSILVCSIVLALTGPATALAAEQPRVVEDPYGEASAPPANREVSPAARGYSPYAGR